MKKNKFLKVLTILTKKIVNIVAITLLTVTTISVVDAYLCTNLEPVKGEHIVNKTYLELRLSQIASMWDKVTAGINYAGGKIGIGTVTPTEKLTINTGNIALTDEYGLGWGSSASVPPTNGIKGSASANYVAIKTGGNEQMRVIADGKVGIGITTPTAKLDVAGNIVAASPTANNHVTTKAYVDGAVSAASSGGKAISCTVICNGTCPTAPTGYTVTSSNGQSAFGRCIKDNYSAQAGPIGVETMCCYFAN